MTLRNLQYDSALRLTVGATKTASFAATDILDFGSGLMEGLVRVNVTACDKTTGDEFYSFIFQGSPDAAFGTAGNIVELGQFSIGGKSPRLSDADKDATTGVYIFPVHNQWADTLYRYFRLYLVCAGTTPSVTYDDIFFAPRYS